MSKKFTSRHGAAMAEPVIVITFFAIISVFLLRMFASTEKVRSSAEETSKSVIRAESVMEYALASDAEDGDLKTLGFREASDDTGKYLVKYYDSKWEETSSDGKYTMKVFVNSERKENGKLVSYIIYMLETENNGDKRDIFTISSKKYMRGGNA